MDSSLEEKREGATCSVIEKKMVSAVFDDLPFSFCLSCHISFGLSIFFLLREKFIDSVTRYALCLGYSWEFLCLSFFASSDSSLTSLEVK